MLNKSSSPSNNAKFSKLGPILSLIAFRSSPNTIHASHNSNNFWLSAAINLGSHSLYPPRWVFLTTSFVIFIFSTSIDSSYSCVGPINVAPTLRSSVKLSKFLPTTMITIASLHYLMSSGSIRRKALRIRGLWSKSVKFLLNVRFCRRNCKDWKSSNKGELGVQLRSSNSREESIVVEEGYSEELTIWFLHKINPSISTVPWTLISNIRSTQLL